MVGNKFEYVIKFIRKSTKVGGPIAFRDIQGHCKTYHERLIKGP